MDIPISNCINSGLNHIYVLAQYNSTSLNRHLCRAYSFVNGVAPAARAWPRSATLHAPSPCSLSLPQNLHALAHTYTHHHYHHHPHHPPAADLFASSHGSGFVECLNATQRPGHVSADAWYQGTADACRHYLGYLEGEKHADAEDVLILSGDQLWVAEGQ